MWKSVCAQLLALAFTAGFVLTGCDRTVAEREKSGRTWTGDYKHERETVKERPDGSRYTEHESSRTRD